MYLFSPYATPKLNSILFSPAIFLTSRKNISPLGSPNLFARRQAFAAIRRRTQWIKRKINGRENEKRRCCASNQGIYAANSLSHLIKKSREQWKLGNILLHMAKINTYDFLSIHTHLYILVQNITGHIKNRLRLFNSPAPQS